MVPRRREERERGAAFPLLQTHIFYLPPLAAPLRPTRSTSAPMAPRTPPCPHPLPASPLSRPLALETSLRVGVRACCTMARITTSGRGTQAK